MALVNNGNIFVPGNFVETAQMLQVQIADTPIEARELEAQKAIALIGSTKEYAGTRDVLLLALSSYIVLKNMDRVEVDTVPLDEAIVRGSLSGIGYLEDGRAISSLCVALRASDILWSRHPMLRKRIDDDLYVPVFGVESIWAA